RQERPSGLFRGPGAEGDRRQGEPRAREPPPERAPGQALIQFFHVTKRYAQGAQALTDVSVHVEKGEFVFLTGPSGAGKTTFPKMGFPDEVPSSGQVVVNGQDVATMPARRVPYLRRQGGVGFQDFKLLPRKTVFENVAFATQVIGLSRKEQRSRTFHVLEMLGLNHR